MAVHQRSANPTSLLRPVRDRLSVTYATLALRPSARLAMVAAPAAALGIIEALDAVASARNWPIGVLALLDDPAHLLTAALVFNPLMFPRQSFPRLSRFWPWAMAGSVLIDLDHVPLFTFAPGFTVDGRPPTHSLVTVVVLLVIAAVAPVTRTALIGLAAGVGLHFLRDVATGPGVPLFWPLSDESITAPYRIYIGVLVAAVVIDTWAVINKLRRADLPAG